MTDDPGVLAGRLCAHLTGTRWPTPSRGLLEVVAARALTEQWPITVAVRIANDDWPGPRSFRITFAAADAYPATGLVGNAEALAEDALIRVEGYLETGAGDRVAED